LNRRHTDFQSFRACFQKSKIDKHLHRNRMNSACRYDYILLRVVLKRAFCPPCYPHITPNILTRIWGLQ